MAISRSMIISGKIQQLDSRIHTIVVTMLKLAAIYKAGNVTLILHLFIYIL